MNLMLSRGSGCLPRSSVMQLLMRRRYASFATSTALPRTAHLAKCRRVASSFSYSNRPRPRWPLQLAPDRLPERRVGDLHLGQRPARRRTLNTNLLPSRLLPGAALRLRLSRRQSPGRSYRRLLTDYRLLPAHSRFAQLHHHTCEQIEAGYDAFDFGVLVERMGTAAD